MSEGGTPPPRDALDDALATWPTKERPAEDWEAAARRIEARLENVAHTRAALDDDALFAAPLPLAEGEPGESVSEGRIKVADRARDRASFQELVSFARQAGLTPPPSGVHRSAPPARKEDSGVIDLKGLAAPEPDAPTALTDDDLVEAVEAPLPAPAPAPLPTPAPARSRGARSWIFGALALAAVAAGALVLLPRLGGPKRDPVATTTRSNPTVATTAAPAPPPAATTAPHPDDDAVDPNALPLAHANRPRVAPSAAKPVAPLPPAPPNAPAPEVAAAAPTDTPPAATATATSADPNDLDQALRQAAGVTPSSAPNADTPQASDPSELPLKPSQGAAQAALAQVLPSARACVGPDDGETQVTVTFGANGGVQRVGVSGGAQGKPAEACIRAAMMRARLAPFAQPSFSWSVIVRPM